VAIFTEDNTIGTTRIISLTRIVTPGEKRERQREKRKEKKER
jgi:hypothetical protein